MDLDVLFLGTAGSAPTAQRGLPATLVRRGGDRLLFDCGEGTQRQLVRSIGLIELEEVFLTHFHADHVLGLPGMLKTFSLRERERPLTVYGPPGLARLFKVLAAARREHTVRARAGRARAERGARARRLPDRRVRGGPRAATRSATRSWRTRGPAASTPSARASWASSRARTSAASSRARP